jgi:hypothetical protein
MFYGCSLKFDHGIRPCLNPSIPHGSAQEDVIAIGANSLYICVGVCFVVCEFLCVNCLCVRREVCVEFAWPL